MKTKIKTETMKDLTKIYLDLSKCTEEQRKHIEFLTGEEFYGYKFCHLGQSAFTGKIKFFGFNEIPKGYSKTELTYPEFIKLFEGGDEVRTELLPDVAYWRHRCLLAEKCLSVSPCDPDITDEQIKAHKDYNQYLETFGNKD